jgi:hypothetical protein
MRKMVVPFLLLGICYLCFKEIGVVLGFFVGIPVYVFISEFYLIPTSTQLYFFFYCKTKLTRKQAKEVCFLIDGSLGGFWHKMTWLKDLHKDDRILALYEFAKKIKGCYL